MLAAAGMHVWKEGCEQYGYYKLKDAHVYISRMLLKGMRLRFMFTAFATLILPTRPREETLSSCNHGHCLHQVLRVNDSALCKLR